MDNYHGVDECERYILLAKNTTTATAERDAGAMQVVMCRQGEWLDVCRFAEKEISVEWRRAVVGRFCGMFLRATICWLNIRYDDGYECRFQLVAENLAGASFRLDCIPADGHDMSKLLFCEKTRRPVAVMFEVGSPSHFTDNVVVKVSQAASRTVTGFSQ